MNSSVETAVLPGVCMSPRAPSCPTVREQQMKGLTAVLEILAWTVETFSEHYRSCDWDCCLNGANVSLAAAIAKLATIASHLNSHDANAKYGLTRHATRCREEEYVVKTVGSSNDVQGWSNSICTPCWTAMTRVDAAASPPALCCIHGLWEIIPLQRRGPPWRNQAALIPTPL